MRSSRASWSDELRLTARKLGGQLPEGLSLSWRLFGCQSDLSQGATFGGVDILIQQQVAESTAGDLEIETEFLPRVAASKTGGDTSLCLTEIFRDAFAAARKGGKRSVSILRLVWPEKNGYIVRSDMLRLRYADADFIEKIVDLTESLQAVNSFTGIAKGVAGLEKMLQAATGGLLVRTADFASLDSCIEYLDTELARRMNYPWYLSEEIRPRRLVIVEGGFNPAFRRDVFRAAKGFGISLIILDRPNHWLQSDTYAHLREQFVEVNLNVDEQLAERIAAALRSVDGKIDGITTYSDKFLEATARAAEMLNLPTEPPNSFRQCLRKDETRISSNVGAPACLLSSIGEIQTWLDEHGLSSPVIVKPVQGAGSVGVCLAKDGDSLIRHASSLFATGHESILIEPFVTGPEVDANFVILDGHVLFCEINDDFPKSAECEFFNHPSSFVETMNVYPSKLPTEEQKLLQTTLHQFLLQTGFKNGVFHLEARVQSSSMEYRVSEAGLLDLVPKEQRDCDGNSASVYLIEANARPPGCRVTAASTHTFGVDYYALQMLFAIGDFDRVRAMSSPFTDRAQYWSVLSQIPVPRGGTMKSGDPLEALRRDKPQLATHIAEYNGLIKKGQAIPDPVKGGRHLWVATALLFTRESREHALLLDKEFRAYLEAFVEIVPA